VFEVSPEKVEGTKYGEPASRERAGPTNAFDKESVLVIPTAVDMEVAAVFAVLMAGVLIRRIPLSPRPFVTVKEGVMMEPLMAAAAVLIRDTVMVALCATKELI
jgi:hypothetical protein